MISGKANWEEARNLIEKEAGSIIAVTELAEGRNSEISVVIRTDADWDLLGFEYVSGAHADYSPGSLDIPQVITTLRQLQQITCPDIDVKQADQRWASYTSAPELLVDNSLLHTDWSPGNVLVNQRAVLVDWAWPTRGAAWIDPACLAVWLIASGHTPRSAEFWTAQIPSWQSAPTGALDEFARIQALMWDGIAADSSELCTKNLAWASRQWASHRETRSRCGGNQDE